MKMFICSAVFYMITLAFCSNAQARDWNAITELPDEAKAVLAFQKWQMPIGRTKDVIARVVHMHAGEVTLQIKGSSPKKIKFEHFEPEYQKLILDWRKWKPRTVYFSEVKEIKDNDGNSMKAKLVATVGTGYAIFKQSGGTRRGNGYHCLALHRIEPYERLNIYRSRFHGEFEPMDVDGTEGDKVKNLGFKSYRWLPTKGDSKQGIPAQLHIPELRRGSKQVPLVIFLHGKGEAGTDNMKQFKHDEILTMIEGKNKRRFPCFLLCPQHPNNDAWFGFGPGIPTNSMKAVTNMVRMLIHDYPLIDPSRIYITGLSSGGRGSLEFLTCWPETYAAAVAMSASLKPKYFNKKNARPFWAIWNEQDLPGAEKTLNEVKMLYKEWRVPMKTTIYDKGGHDAWSEGYTEEGFVKWMFAQQLGKRR